MSDLISREDAINAVAVAVLDDRDELEAIKAIPSVQVNGDLISRQDAIEAVCRTRCGDKAKGCPAHSCLVIEEFDALPSAETHEIRTETHGVCSDLISRADAIEAMCGECLREHCETECICGCAFKDILSTLPSAEAVPHGRLIDADALYKKATDLWDKSDSEDFEKGIFKLILNAPTVSDESVQGGKENEFIQILKSWETNKADAISKRFVSDAILQKISELNAQGEKAIPIAREFIRFKRFVDGLTPIITDAVQGWIPFTRRPMTEEEQKDYPNCTFMFDCVLPDDGDEILVSNRSFVWMDTFCSDIDGCYLDSGDDIDEDMAWMPLPKPYKGGDDE